ncbi:MAG: hypothetical protein QM756_08340 [Polyangiaceae bacterium]
MHRQLSLVACLALSACAAASTDETDDVQVSLSALSALPSMAPAATRASLVHAASRLCDLEADRAGDPAHNGDVDGDPDDGGWDWLVDPATSSHTSSPSLENLYGSVASAVWAGARLAPRDARFRALLVDASSGAAARPEVDSPTDFVWLTLLSDMFHERSYSALARARYDARITAAGGATALGLALAEARHAAGADGLIAYDLAWYALSAAALGYRGDYESFVRVGLDDLNSSTPSFDYRDGHEAYYVQGLSWSLLLASWSRSSRALFSELDARLLAQQLPNGAFGYNDDFPAANLQATAHALTVLGLARRAAPHSVSHAAAAWLLSEQAENGGWVYTPGQEYPLLDAEITLGVFLADTAAGSRGLVSAARLRAALEVPSTPPALALPPR